MPVNRVQDQQLALQAFAIADRAMWTVLGERFSQGAAPGLLYPLDPRDPERTMAARHHDAISWLTQRGLIEVAPGYVHVLVLEAPGA